MLEMPESHLEISPDGSALASFVLETAQPSCDELTFERLTEYALALSQHIRNHMAPPQQTDLLDDYETFINPEKALAAYLDIGAAYFSDEDESPWLAYALSGEPLDDDIGEAALEAMEQAWLARFGYLSYGTCLLSRTKPKIEVVVIFSSAPTYRIDQLHVTVRDQIFELWDQVCNRFSM